VFRLSDNQMIRDGAAEAIEKIETALKK